MQHTLTFTAGRRQRFFLMLLLFAAACVVHLYNVSYGTLSARFNQAGQPAYVSNFYWSGSHSYQNAIGGKLPLLWWTWPYSPPRSKEVQEALLFNFGSYANEMRRRGVMDSIDADREPAPYSKLRGLLVAEQRRRDLRTEQVALAAFGLLVQLHDSVREEALAIASTLGVAPEDAPQDIEVMRDFVRATPQKLAHLHLANRVPADERAFHGDMFRSTIYAESSGNTDSPVLWGLWVPLAILAFTRFLSLGWKAQAAKVARPAD